jgi:hypothetical protein
MTTRIIDPALERRLRAEREASGADRYDEVWEGAYMMTPMPNVEHQDIINGFAAVFQATVRWSGLGMVMPGANVTDRETDWQGNYRVPDIAVFLKTGSARNRDTHWQGGPDLVVEVTSPNDQTREKIPFYSQIGARELLIVERDGWWLELFRLRESKLVSVGQSVVSGPELRSQVLPMAFSLVPGDPRPEIQVRQMEQGQVWTI